MFTPDMTHLSYSQFALSCQENRCYHAPALWSEFLCAARDAPDRMAHLTLSSRPPLPALREGRLPWSCCSPPRDPCMLCRPLSPKPAPRARRSRPAPHAPSSRRPCSPAPHHARRKRSAPTRPLARGRRRRRHLKRTGRGEKAKGCVRRRTESGLPGTWRSEACRRGRRRERRDDEMATGSRLQGAQSSLEGTCLTRRRCRRPPRRPRRATAGTR